MKTLSDLQDAIKSKCTGSVTLSLVANGKALASGTFGSPFVSRHEWGDSISDALIKLFSAAPVIEPAQGSADEDDEEDLL